MGWRRFSQDNGSDNGLSSMIFLVTKVMWFGLCYLSDLILFSAVLFIVVHYLMGQINLNWKAKWEFPINWIIKADHQKASQGLVTKCNWKTVLIETILFYEWYYSCDILTVKLIQCYFHVALYAKQLALHTYFRDIWWWLAFGFLRKLQKQTK